MATGQLWGSVGVLLFSMSLPASRMAVDAFDPVFVGCSRGAVAGLLAMAVLTLERAGWPHRREWPLLAIVGLGVVLGFPLLTTVAVAQAGAIHGAILTGLLPAGTAVAAVLLARERPSLAFWLAALAGVLCVLAFAAVQGGGHLSTADGLLLLAVIACSAGYAAGGVLARRMGGLRVIGWALVACLPVTIPLMLATWDANGIATAAPKAWLGYGYVVFISQYLGFFAWYRALAQGGVARVGQLQLAQPVLSMLWAALLLGEPVTPEAVLAALAVLACVVMTQRAR